jgi:signal transduction histidine kinase
MTITTPAREMVKTLLVEDSPIYARTLKDEIARSEPGDMEMTIAASLKEAEEALRRQHFDAVLLDLTLPDSSGLESVSWAQRVCPELPVIVLSAMDDDATGVEAVRMGVQNYLVKGHEDAWTIKRAIHYAIELKKLGRALGRSMEKLRNQNQELETIIRIISHDLRAPLLNVRGFNHLVKKDCARLGELLKPLAIPQEARKEIDEVLDESMAESTDFIEASATAMDNLAKLLVKVARSGSVTPEPEMLDMNEIAKGVVGSINIRLKNAAANVSIGELPGCYADRTHVTQVFTNLVENAIKYLDSARPGQISIGGRSDEMQAVYVVEDNGIGIAPEHQDKIFDVFYRIIERTAIGGEGIGLSVVKRMVERNNGRVWVESEKGKGSRFHVALPLGPMQ